MSARDKLEKIFGDECFCDASYNGAVCLHCLAGGVLCRADEILENGYLLIKEKMEELERENS